MLVETVDKKTGKSKHFLIETHSRADHGDSNVDYDDTSGPKWTQLDQNGPRWTQEEPLVSGGFIGSHWSQEDPSGPNWSQEDPSGPNWSQSDQDGPRWTQEEPRGPKWSQEDPSGPNWSQGDPAEPSNEKQGEESSIKAL